VLGGLLGGLLRSADLSPRTIDLVGFPGDIMLRLLKMLVVPLVSLSMVSGICALKAHQGGHKALLLAKFTAIFYVVCTVVAIMVGLFLVVVIQPGRNAPFDRMSTASGCVQGGVESAHVDEQNHSQSLVNEEVEGPASTGEALLQVVRMIVPDNITKAAIDMNVLGIITFSLLFGWALSSLGPQAAPVIDAVNCLNAAVGKMVTAALWVSPVGVGSLIAAAMLRSCDLASTAAALSLWAATVVVGLLLFSGVFLPAALIALTSPKASPYQVTSHFAQALLLAFGTSCSAASLPLAMEGARNAGCDEAVVSFFLPLGISMNLSGTALYEATTAVFIAQAHGISLGISGMVVVAVTASLAAVGAPAIPSAGLVTMLIVLQAVGLAQYSGDLAVILAADWILDRVRTTVNLLGDAYGCVIVDSLLKKRGGIAGGGGGGGTPATSVGAKAYQSPELGSQGGAMAIEARSRT